MKTYYNAKSVTVFKFSHDPDLSGMIIPPECYTTFDKEVPVVFNDYNQDVVGWVKLRREGDQILGDFRMQSTMVPAGQALELMRKLTPGIGFEIHDAYGNLILMLRITHVAVTPNGNVDPSIEPFGNKIHCLSKGLLN